MSIDFSLSEELELLRKRVRSLISEEVRPLETSLSQAGAGRGEWRKAIADLRQIARGEGLWLPHMPAEYGGMGLGPTALAMVSAEAARSSIGPFVINCQAPDEGNMHTLMHFGTDDQKQRYLLPLCEGISRSCFAMTEPEVSGSDPSLIQTSAVQEDEGGPWTINGHKWFISGARGAKFAILLARTEEAPADPRAANTAFIVDLPKEGWELVRDVETMSGSHNHCEIMISDLKVEDSQILGQRGGGHRLGQARLGPARLAHCMRWIGQAETALEMMIDRATSRYTHGSMLSEKQGIQWMVTESAMELYQGKLMVLHAAYLLENGKEFRTEVSMAKHHVANALCRIVDRALQVHGALGYSTDTPLASMYTQARWSRLADGADEVHLANIASRVIANYVAGSGVFGGDSLPL